MKKARNLTGMVFKNLTVLRIHNERDKQGNILWLCKCSCGKELLIRSYCFNQGIESCGCAQNIRSRSKDVALTQKYNSYKRDARVRKLEFSLTKEEFKFLLQGDCSYCGDSPKEWSPYIKSDGNFAKTVKDGSINLEYVKSTTILKNGIDRINNNQGYTIENCSSCCGTCNLMKKVLSSDDFLNHVKKISAFQNSLISVKIKV